MYQLLTIKFLSVLGDVAAIACSIHIQIMSPHHIDHIAPYLNCVVTVTVLGTLKVSMHQMYY